MTDYGKLLHAQKEYWLTGATRPLDFRIAKLMKLQKAVKEKYPEIIAALQKDIGKSEFESFTTEVMCVLDELKQAIKHLRSWAKPKRAKTPIVAFKASSRIYPEPYGCVLVITAWNYPFLLAMNPLIGAVSAGNCCIIKPSETAPHTSAVVKEIINDIYEENFCTVVEGAAEETTMLLKQSFDMIHYTGSERVGKIIARAAAENLTPVILELGGKSPCIVDETADTDMAAKRIIWGKLLNAGQTCVAPDYVLAHEAIKENFLASLVKYRNEFYKGLTEGCSDYCHIINKKNYERLLSCLEGSDIIAGGKCDTEELFIEPTILNNVTWESPVMKEEIFGPILPVLTYSEMDEAIRMIHSHSKPLALYYFTKDRKREKKMIECVSFGGGCINATLMHTVNPNLPFGGVGNSGMGYYHGKWGFEAFSHQKSVLKKSTAVDFKLIYPPYKDKLKMLKRFYF